MKEDEYKKAKVIIAVTTLVILSVLGWAHVNNERYYYHTKDDMAYKHDKWTDNVTVNNDRVLKSKYREDSKKHSGYESITYDL